MSLICPHCQTSIVTATPSGGAVVCPSCGSSIAPSGKTTTGYVPADGSRRVGKFELLEEVGAGAFGTVYKARDIELDRIVAIKLPRAGSLGSTAGEKDRFLREARSAAQLRHPSIISVHEVGQHDGLLFLVEDFVPGMTLADMLSGERLPSRQAAELIVQVADALHYAHEHGVIHRDVKPSNIMLERTGETGGYVPRLMDFGLAKRDGIDGTLTAEGQVLGTPAYMSPEQARGEGHSVDGRSDVYALGVILYELLTGVLPFKGNSRLLLDQVLHAEPVPPRKRDSKIPKDLETICLAAMAKEPARRYASARELADDLRRYLAGEPIRARPVGIVERTLKRIRRNPAQAAVAGLVALLLIGGAMVGGWLWYKADLERREDEARRLADEDAKQLKVSYFNTIVKRRGVPEGVGPLTAEEAQRREQTYRLSHRGGRLEKVELINGHGHPPPEPGEAGPIASDAEQTGQRARTRGECANIYRYDSSGRLTDETASNHMGHPLWRFHYTNAETGHYTDARGFPRAHAATGATYVAFTWTPEGFLREMRFLDPRRRPKPDGQRIYGVRYDHDARGLPVRATYLDPEGRPWANNDGIGGWTKVYDARGNPIETSYFAADGKPALHRRDGAKVVVTYDAWGNEVRKDFFGLHGEPTFNRAGRVAAIVSKRDPRGNEIETAYLGTDGRSVASNVRVARIDKSYDDRGNIREMKFFGLKGEPVLHRDGGHGWTARYDEHDNQIERAYFGIDGKPILLKGGHAKSTFKWDHRGYLTEFAVFGSDGKPVLSRTSGFARLVQKFDDYGLNLEGAVFGVDGKPTLSRTTGGAVMKYQYDDYGNQVEATWHNVDGQPMMSRHGYARVRQTYDDVGNPIELTLWDREGKPVLADSFGAARITNKYNDRGFRIETALHGVDGRPVLHRTERSARNTTVVDERGNALERRWFGVNGEPVLNYEGFARVTWQYDERGNTIESASFGIDDKPIQDRWGNVRITQKFDARGNRVHVGYYGVDGRPSRDKDGRVAKNFKYDDRDQLIEETILGLDGKPALFDYGFATVLYGRDARGNAVDWTYLDAAGKPVLTMWGYAKARRIYNERDVVVDVLFFDLAGKPVKVEVRIDSVVAGGMADRMGLKAGDALVSFAGQEVKSRVAFEDLHKEQIRAQELIVRRGDQTLKFRIPPGDGQARITDWAVGHAPPISSSEQGGKK